MIVFNLLKKIASVFIFETYFAVNWNRQLSSEVKRVIEYHLFYWDIAC